MLEYRQRADVPPGSSSPPNQRSYEREPSAPLTLTASTALDGSLRMASQAMTLSKSPSRPSGDAQTAAEQTEDPPFEEATTGWYLAHMIDVNNRRIVTLSAWIEFLDAVRLLPDARERALDRGTLTTMLQRLFARYDPNAVDGREPALVLHRFATLIDSELPVSGQMLHEMISEAEMANERQRRLTEVVDMRRQAEADLVEYTAAVEQLTTVLSNGMASLRQKQAVNGPLRSTLQAKEQELSALQEKKKELLRSCEDAFAEVECTNHLVEHREGEVRGWEMRQAQWRSESQNIAEEMEKAEVEEHVLLKRLEEVRHRKTVLAAQQEVVQREIEVCRASMTSTVIDLDDAGSMRKHVLAAAQAATHALEDLEQRLTAVSSALNAGYQEVANDDTETTRIQERLRRLEQDRSAACDRIRTKHADLQHLILQEAQLREGGDAANRRPASTERLSLFVDELRIANERHRAPRKRM